MFKFFIITILCISITYLFASDIRIKAKKQEDITNLKFMIKNRMERNIETFKARVYTEGSCSNYYQIETFTKESKSDYVKMIKVYRDNNLFSTIVTSPNISRNPIFSYKLKLEKELPFSVIYMTNKDKSELHSTSKLYKQSKESYNYALDTKKIHKQYNSNNAISSKDITIILPPSTFNRTVIPLTVKSNIKLYSFAVFSDRTQTPLIIYVKNEKASYIDFYFKFKILDNTTFDYNITVVGKDENGTLHKSVVKSKLSREGDCCGCV